jgi:hypothetical protein
MLGLIDALSAALTNTFLSFVRFIPSNVKKKLPTINENSSAVNRVGIPG